MLLTFRLFVFAAGLVIVALAVTTRGLVPEPEARTRIGEVPSVGRSLVQQAIIPPSLIERRSVDAEIGPVGELRGTRDSSGPAAEDALTIGSAVGGSMPASQLAGSRGEALQSGGGEDIAKLGETPRAPPHDTAQAPPTTEQILDREAAGSAQAAPATVPVAAPAPTEPVRDDDASALARSASGAIGSLFVAPALPSLATLRPSASFGLDELAEAPIPAGPHAMAFGAEPESSRTGETPAHAARDLDRLSSLPADATAKTKSVRATKRITAKHEKRSTAAKSERKVAKRTHKKVKTSRRATPAKREAVVPALGATDIVQGVPQTYQYLYAVPLRPHVVAPEWTSVR